MFVPISSPPGEARRLPAYPSDKMWAIQNDQMEMLPPLPPFRFHSEADQQQFVIRAQDMPLATVADGIGIINLIGPIEKRGSMFGLFAGFASLDRLRLAVNQLVQDPDVRTIMLVIDSPGGSTDGLAEAADVIFEARQSKTVVAQVSGTTASAAYWLASQATTIAAGRMDLIGSLGVRLLLYDFSEMFAKAGVKPVVIDTGGVKSAGAPGTVITEEQVGYFQGLVDAFGREFKAAVRRGRDMSAGQVDALFDGRMHIAPQAKALGLIDRISSFDQTFDRLRSARTGRGRRRALAARVTAAAMRSS